MCTASPSEFSHNVNNGILHPTSDSKSKYFVDKSDNSDVEDLRYCISEEGGGGEHASCYICQYLFVPEADNSEIDDESLVTVS